MDRGVLVRSRIIGGATVPSSENNKNGKNFVTTLPLEKVTEDEKVFEQKDREIDHSFDKTLSKLEIISERLRNSATNPAAEGKIPGFAFEEAIADMFSYMGFKAEHIGGSGDTDVVLRWKGEEGNTVVAIVDGKSKSNGQVSHGDISDIALDTHKEKNNADYVVVVGPGFSGDTIRNFAIKKEYALITDKQLIEIANASEELGLSLHEISLMFKALNGFSQLEEIISSRRRELDIISEIIKQFCNEQELLGSLSPRDLFLLLRNSIVSPSLEELISGFEMLSGNQIGVLQKVNKNNIPENAQYILCNGEKAINRMRAVASAIEKGLQ